MSFELALQMVSDNVVRATLKNANERINANPNPPDVKGQIELASARRVRDLAIKEAYKRKLTVK